MNKKTSWGAVADWYEDLIENDKDSYQKNVIMPNIIRIIDPKKGQKILDVACGQGYFSRAFAMNGAEVTGCDISPELIAFAKKNSPQTDKNGSANYFVSSADRFMSVQVMQGKESCFDSASIVLALQNIENFSGAISECSRALKKGGKLVIVLNHPAFRIPQNSSWEWSKSAAGKPEEKEYRRVDSYMSDKHFEIDMTPGEKIPSKKKFTVSFHRPLQSYFKAFNKSGFAVTRLEEWISHRKSQPGPRADEEDRMRKEIPLFICLEATKLN